MVYLTRKKIKGKYYTYLVKSIRFADGTTKKITKLVNSGAGKSVASLEKLYKDYFLEKEIKMNIEYASRKFRQSYIFSRKEIEKLERIKVSYRHLLRKLDSRQKKDIFDRFTANFTYNTNAMEGNSLTLKDVRIVLFENAVIKGKDLGEIYETRNSRKIADLILKKKFDITGRDIIKIHKIIMRDIDSRSGYKKIPNVILSLGREIKTTPPEKVEKEMDKLIEFYNFNLNKMHPLELASIFHGKFERIHPFEDGNGRVGRILINVILIKNGYPPLIIRKSMRSSYISALRASDNEYEDKIKRFMIRKFKDTFEKFFQVYVKYV